MAKSRFVSYLRVSIARQGTSGLGLEAQRAAVAGFLNGGDWTLVEEVLEVESGKRNDRPALAIAHKLCRRHRATLVIAKLDRLARNTASQPCKKDDRACCSPVARLWGSMNTQRSEPSKHMPLLLKGAPRCIVSQSIWNSA